MPDDASNRVADAFRKLTLHFAKRFELAGLRGAKLIRQLVDGTFETRLDDAKIPGDTKVPYLVGLPGWKVKVPPGVRGAVAFLHGDRSIPAIPHVVGFDAGGDVTELAFDGGTAPIAKVGSTVGGGHLLIVMAGPPPVVSAITYFPPGTLPDPAPPGTLIALSGVVTSGIPKLLG
jgi:hypothetical protein